MKQSSQSLIYRAINAARRALWIRYIHQGPGVGPRDLYNGYPDYQNRLLLFASVPHGPIHRGDHGYRSTQYRLILLSI